MFPDVPKPISDYLARSGIRKTAAAMSTRGLISRTSIKMFFSKLLNSQEKTLKKKDSRLKFISAMGKDVMMHTSSKFLGN